MVSAIMFLLWGNSKLDLVYISIDASVRIYVFQELLKEQFGVVTLLKKNYNLIIKKMNIC